MTDCGPITATRPKGYRAREFRDSDRETWVEDRNAERHELQQGSADEWRDRDKLNPPADLFRVAVETSEGRPVAGTDVGPGFFPRPDGTVHGGVGVMRGHRKNGLGGALLEVMEAEARRRTAPRILAGTDASLEGALEWAQERGYREIGRRIESYVYVQAFDPSPFQDIVDRVSASGLQLRSLGECSRAVTRLRPKRSGVTSTRPTRRCGTTCHAPRPRHTCRGTSSTR